MRPPDACMSLAMYTLINVKRPFSPTHENTCTNPTWAIIHHGTAAQPQAPSSTLSLQCLRS